MTYAAPATATSSATRTTTRPRPEQVSAAPAVAAFIRSAILMPGRPRRLSRMNGPRDPRKYTEITDKSVQLAAASLEGHALGHVTYAASLDQNGLALAGVIEIDAGGQAAVVATLQAARALGVVAWAVLADTPGGHSGGHVWCQYATPQPVAHIVAHMRQIASLAGLPEDTEIYPRNQGIRLPFGYHRRMGGFGRILLPSGECFDLDAGEQAAALAAVQALPRNAAPPAIEAPTTTTAAPAQPQAAPAPQRKVINLTRRQSIGEAAAERLNTAEIAAKTRARFNAEHTLERLLEGLGARRTKDGYSCPCGRQHSHETTLYISKLGKLFSYSPQCGYYTTKGHDAFSLYVLTEHRGHYMAALECKAREYGLWVTVEPKRQHEPHPAEVQEYRTSDQAHEAERKRAARRAQAAATLAAVTARASQDEHLSTRAQLVLMALLESANGRNWTRESAPALSERIGPANNGQPYGERWVREGIRELRDAGYIHCEGKGGASHCTAIRTFLAAPPDVSTYDRPAPARSDEYISRDLQEETREQVSAAPASPAAGLDLQALAAFDAYEPAPEWEPWCFDLGALVEPPTPIDQPGGLGAGSQAPPSVEPPALVEVLPDGEGASFDPSAALVLSGASYSGRAKDRATQDEIHRASSELWQRHAALFPVLVAGDAAPVEQAPLGDLVPRARPQRSGGKVDHPRYRQRVAVMREVELAAELSDLLDKLEHAVPRVKNKTARASWAKDLREKIGIVQEAIDAYDQVTPAALVLAPPLPMLPTPTAPAEGWKVTHHHGRWCAFHVETACSEWFMDKPAAVAYTHAIVMTA